MNKLQKEILNIYTEFLKICEKHELNFFAIGGTCIGAIRHKGFIPWDDDIDVAMPIEDYLKFKEIAKIELPLPYELIDYLDEKNHYQYFLKIQNTNTTYIETIEKFNKNRYKGVFIDIMPLIGCPKNKVECNKFMEKMIFYRKMNELVNNTYSERQSVKSKVSWILFRPFSIFYKKNYFIKKWNDLLTKYEFDEKNDIMLPWRLPTIRSYCTVFIYNIFKKPISVPFETTKMYIPEEYDNYLKLDFGDYMKLPPKEKQVSVHNVVKIDLNKSYKEYNPKDFKKVGDDNEKDIR